MLSIPSKPKFFLLNALRGLSMISLLFVFIANVVIMVDDIKALQSKDPDAEECDYLEGSGIPNQPAGDFRAFLSISLNIIQTIVLFLSETGFPASIFKKWIPCLDNESSLVGIGVLELLLSAQLLSHFLEPYPLVACFFLFFAGIFNLCTMYMDRPRFFRSIAFWKGNALNEARSMESGHSRAYTHSAYTHSAAPSLFTEKQHHTPASEEYGFARQDESILSRSTTGVARASSPPTYSPPKAPLRAYTKGGLGNGSY